jgi:hypothetical protein
MGWRVDGCRAKERFAFAAIGPRLVVLDLADPLQPRAVSELRYSEVIRTLALDGASAYLTLPDSLHVLDLSDALAPREVGRIVRDGTPRAARLEEPCIRLRLFNDRYL